MSSINTEFHAFAVSVWVEQIRDITISALHAAKNESLDWKEVNTQLRRLATECREYARMLTTELGVRQSGALSSQYGTLQPMSVFQQYRGASSLYLLGEKHPDSKGALFKAGYRYALFKQKPLSLKELREKNQALADMAESRAWLNRLDLACRDWELAGSQQAEALLLKIETGEVISVNKNEDLRIYGPLVPLLEISSKVFAQLSAAHA